MISSSSISRASRSARWTERRRKHSPLRDVAGMLRSFSYAAAIALDEATSDRPADRVRAATHMTRWRAGDRRGVFDRLRARDARHKLVSIRSRRRGAADRLVRPGKGALRGALRAGLASGLGSHSHSPASSNACKSRQRPREGRRARDGRADQRLARETEAVGLDAGMAPVSISRCIRKTPKRVELCLFDPKGRREIERGSTYANAPTSSGIAICPKPGPASFTATACTVRTHRSAAIGSTRTSCCSTRTPAWWPGRYAGPTRISAIASEADAKI